MFVLFDIEWVTAEDGARTITQLAAMQTTEAWHSRREFHALIKPTSSDCDWTHPAYSGYSPAQFQTGISEESCIRMFCNWLKPDDILCCWHYQSGRTLSALYKHWFGRKFPFRWSAANNEVYAALEQRGIVQPGGLYECARLCGLETLSPEHNSCHDVAVFQLLLQKLHLPSTRLIPKHTPKETKPFPEDLTLREKNAIAIQNSQYNYLYLPASQVFHRRECKLILNSQYISGCIHYSEAIESRRPCKVCKPVPMTEEEELTRSSLHDAKQLSTLHKKLKAQGRSPASEIVRVRLLGGKTVEIGSSALVGCCHYYLHPGKLTQKLMEEHDCLEKQCRFFEKYEAANYWKERAQKEVLRQQLKKQKKLKKEQAVSALSLQEQFQVYADSIGYSLKIVRVQQEKTGAFKIFYVSENPFRDGNLFPNFLEMLRTKHPGHAVLMRHIQDVSGHFVTIEEYEQLRR